MKFVYHGIRGLSGKRSSFIRLQGGIFLLKDIFKIGPECILIKNRLSDGITVCALYRDLKVGIKPYNLHFCFD